MNVSSGTGLLGLSRTNGRYMVDVVTDAGKKNDVRSGSVAEWLAC